MNKLVAGEITATQATALWDASEEGAERRIERFQRLDAGLARSLDECAPPSAAAGGNSCAKAARAVARTIHTARNAVRTWKLHIIDMDKLRDGKITGEQAEQKWERLWRTGKAQTVRYDHRAAHALAHECR
jgi:hypothetical protein